MVTVRRSYVYLVSGISLLAITAALINLLTSILPPGAVAPVGTLALLIAVIVIALPFFLFHWLWAARSARSDVDERSSFIRRFYLYALLSIFLGAFVVFAYNLVHALLQVGLNIRPTFPSYMHIPPPEEIAVDAALGLLVLGPFWLYHVLVVRMDSQAAPETEIGAGIRRLYLFGFAGAGLVLAVVAVSQFVRLALYLIGGGVTLGPAERTGLLDELTRLIVGAPLWLVFWVRAQGLFAGGSEDERASAVRKLYLYLVIFGAALGTVSAATVILAGLLRQLLGLRPSGDLRDTLAAALTLAVIWAYHWFILRGDVAVAAEAPLQAGIRRLYHYLVAAIGLGALLIGLAGVVSVLIRTLGGDNFTTNLREPLAWFTAALVVGIPVWLWPWRSAQLAARTTDAAGMSERRSVVRKLYLYFYLFAATMTVLGSAIYIVSQLLSLALGGRTGGNLISDLGQPFAWSLIAVAVWLYHGAVLRGDGQMAQHERAERLQQIHVAVVDLEQGQWGQSVVEGLRRELPGLSLIPIGLTSAARQALGIAASEAPLAAQLGDSRLIVGPWMMAAPGAAGGAVTAEMAWAIQASPARKLLVPLPCDGMDWVGVEHPEPRALAQQAVRAVKQFVEGEEPKSRGGLHPAVMVILALIGLCVALQLVSALVSFLLMPRF